MTTVIIAALALTFVQLVLIPSSLSLKHLPFLISSRDELPPEQTTLQGRVTRAGLNLRESLPAFLALCLLAMIVNIDLTQVAQIWIGLRIVYLLCYMFNIIYVRTLVWAASIGCLIFMAMKLL